MIITCPSCQARYKLDPSKGGGSAVSVRCPKCRHLFRVDLSPTPSDPPRILIVDDALFFREMISDVLRPLGMEIMAVDSAEKALEMLRGTPYVLAVVDLNLPGMSGEELIQIVRQDLHLKDLRILAMSGVFRSEADAARVQNSGADDFSTKSFTPDQLQQKVRTLLDRG
ncbi:MAG: hypothetical protein C0621_04535 [Desulfuromonas sp.]|nr:MAG: hypothetical protein C0621_04535 [Desulfuromonas sp.]